MFNEQDFLSVGELAALTGYTPNRLRRSVHNRGVGEIIDRRIILDLGEALDAIAEADRIEARQAPIQVVELKDLI